MSKLDSANIRDMDIKIQPRRLPVTTFITPELSEEVDEINKTSLEDKENLVLSKSKILSLIIEEYEEEIDAYEILELRETIEDPIYPRVPITVYVLPEIFGKAEIVSRELVKKFNKNIGVSTILSIIIESHEEEVDYDYLLDMLDDEVNV